MGGGLCEKGQSTMTIKSRKPLAVKVSPHYPPVIAVCVVLVAMHPCGFRLIPEPAMALQLQVNILWHKPALQQSWMIILEHVYSRAYLNTKKQLPSSCASKIAAKCQCKIHVKLRTCGTVLPAFAFFLNNDFIVFIMQYYLASNESKTVNQFFHLFHSSTKGTNTSALFVHTKWNKNRQRRCDYISDRICSKNPVPLNFDCAFLNKLSHPYHLNRNGVVLPAPVFLSSNVQHYL